MTEQQRGHLKIYMGYAAGIGKTYKMLEEAQALKRLGKDIVIGYFEPRGREDTIAKAEGLEVMPRKIMDYNGATREEVDTTRILARHPQICVIDELPHSNTPGSERAKRWEDVLVLLDAGISVLTTMDIQNLESLNDEVRHISGVIVQETVPDWIVQSAEEVVMIDLTPRALLHRLERGVVFKGDEVQDAVKTLFRESTLVALRELALLETAHEVECRITSGETGLPESAEYDQQLRKQQKILVYLTADPKTAMVTRRAKRVSDFLGADCFAVAVYPSGASRGSVHADREAIEKHVNFARNLHIETRILEGKDSASAIINFARRNQITQIFISRPRASIWPSPFSRDPLQRIIKLAEDMEIVIVSDRDPVRS